MDVGRERLPLRASGLSIFVRACVRCMPRPKQRAAAAFVVSGIFAVLEKAKLFVRAYRTVALSIIQEALQTQAIKQAVNPSLKRTENTFQSHIATAPAGHIATSLHRPRTMIYDVNSPVFRSFLAVGGGGHGGNFK